MTDITQELRGLIAGATPTLLGVNPAAMAKLLRAGAEQQKPRARDFDDINFDIDGTLISRAINHLPALLDRLEAAERGWQPIETAPRVKGEYFFCHLAWMQGDEFCTADGFGWNGRWFAAALFYRNAPLGECQHEMRQIEVTPTHWMQKPDAPAIREVKP